MSEGSDEAHEEHVLISVAMCTYKAMPYLREQLGSILPQTRLPDEVVTCDDGSIDDTVAEAQREAKSAHSRVSIQELCRQRKLRKSQFYRWRLIGVNYISLPTTGDPWTRALNWFSPMDIGCGSPWEWMRQHCGRFGQPCDLRDAGPMDQGGLDNLSWHATGNGRQSRGDTYELARLPRASGQNPLFMRV